MNQSMINSAVTMGQLQKKLDTVGNNLANVNTIGFKRRDVSFNDLLFQQVNNLNRTEFEGGRDTPLGIRRGTGAIAGQTEIRFDQGAIRETGRDLDFAMTEKGYFFEIAPDEEGNRRFTREGNFYYTPNPADDAENFIVNSQGDFVLGADGEPLVVPVPNEGVTVLNNGTVRVNFAEDEEVDIGQFQMVNITRPQLLQNVGENNFVFGDLDELGLGFDDVLEDAVGENVVLQRALEMSNVDMSREMTSMIEAQRAYQFNASAIGITDQMKGLVTNLR
ncbi:flagellar hook-basal body protein [Salisediminibacterium selenitireducens]|uniref:Fagellar hook-basal body protein n=1 Tax=Bacillus selenitireducens (strain ATCC 700615 / DSM 15326 / MLS10) TaxID=439292 RepID=D6Y0P9_BACIE|nr:flagellar hook-basal body protein [Salisediminibacterium selenitireducens]ADI00617.1 fagellar hook-basal body protein [[Bacillus] selenitireducens MLS10]